MSGSAKVKTPASRACRFCSEDFYFALRYGNELPAFRFWGIRTNLNLLGHLLHRLTTLIAITVTVVLSIDSEKVGLCDTKTQCT